MNVQSNFLKFSLKFLQYPSNLYFNCAKTTQYAFFHSLRLVFPFSPSYVMWIHSFDNKRSTRKEANHFLCRSFFLPLVFFLVLTHKANKKYINLYVSKKTMENPLKKYEIFLNNTEWIFHILWLCSVFGSLGLKKSDS